jgi:hypothetical protein
MERKYPANAISQTTYQNQHCLALLTRQSDNPIIPTALINIEFNLMNKILKLSASSFVLMTSLLLVGCEEKEEIKQETTEVKQDVKQALSEAWQDAKESGKEFKDESLTQLIDETKALGHTLATEGKALSKDLVEDSKEFSKDLVEQGKEMASDATDEAKKAADELAKKIKAQREAIENSN